LDGLNHCKWCAVCGWLSLTSSWTSSQGGGEVASYAPWVTATNAALSLLRSITVPGTRPMRTGDDEILMQQNDPNMKHQRNSQTTLRKPDNLFLKAAVAKRLWESDSWEEVANNNAFRKLPSRDQWKKQLKDNSWNDKLQWIDTLCSCEHKVRYVPDQEDQEDVLEANESETPGWSFRIASTLHPHGQVAGTNPTTSPHKDLGLSLYLISRYLSHVAQGNRTPPPRPTSRRYHKPHRPPTYFPPYHAQRSALREPQHRGPSVQVCATILPCDIFLMFRREQPTCTLPSAEVPPNPIRLLLCQRTRS